MLFPFTDSSIDNVLLQTSWIHKHFWTSSGSHTALWQSNLVID